MRNSLNGGNFVLYNFRKNKKFKLKINVYVCLLLFTFFSLGVSTGCRNFSLTEDNYEVIKGYFQENPNFNDVYKDSFLKNVKVISLISVFGLSLVGVPVVLYFVFSQGLALGSGICAVFSVCASNVLSTACNLIPQVLLYISALMLSSYYCFEFSMFLCRKVLFMEKRMVNNKSIIVFFIVFSLSVLFCYFAALCEGWFMPVIK